MKRLLPTALLLALSLSLAGTLEDVQRRGVLRCGVTGLPPGAVVSAEDFGLHGLHAAVCRALAAAVLGDAAAVEFLALDETNQFLALRHREVDLLVGNNPVTYEHDVRREIHFGPIVFFEGASGQATVVRHGDDAWLDTVTWVFYALVQAEEWGVGARDVGRIGAESPLPAPLAAFAGFEADLTVRLGLPPDGLRLAIAQVGNYGEIYERHLGESSTDPVPRGQNRLWLDGGRMIAPPSSPR